MKICLVSDNLVGYHKYWSGAELVCKILADSLEKEGQDVLFLTTKVQNKDNLGKIVQVPTIVGKPKLLQKISAPFYILWGSLYSLYKLSKNRPDMINFMHSNYLFSPVMIAAILLKIPTVFTFLDYYMICPKATFRMANEKICNSVEGNICRRCISRVKYMERLLLRSLKKRLDGVITFTETSKKRLLKHGFLENQTKVIYTYNIPFEFSQKKADSTKKDSVLVVASFNEHKGLHIVLKAFALVLKEVPSAKLVVVGQGNKEDTNRINNLVKDLGLSSSVTFLGQKSNEETLEEILRNEMAVVAEQWPSEFGPLALVEAMALGKPVVAGDIGSVHDFVRDGVNSYLAKYDSPEDFSRKIVDLLKNKEKAVEFGNRAREDGRILFSYDQGKKSLEFFKEIIKE
jgi:glycosyltransferase involved in cell wall biosynthesis